MNYLKPHSVQRRVEALRGPHLNCPLTAIFQYIGPSFSFFFSLAAPSCGFHFSAAYEKYERKKLAKRQAISCLAFAVFSLFFDNVAR